MTAPEADNEPLRRALGKAARPKRAPSLFRSFPLRRSLEADRKLEQHVFRLRSGGELQHGLFRSSVSAILHRGRRTDVKFVKISCKAWVRVTSLVRIELPQCVFSGLGPEFGDLGEQAATPQAQASLRTRKKSKALQMAVRLSQTVGIHIRLLVLLLLGARMASAQAPSFGLRAGVPITSLLESAAPHFQVVTHRYTIGPTVELNLPHRFVFEADLLYKRLEYTFAPPNSSTSNVKASRWELPLMLEYKFAGQRLRPFLGLGGSFNRVVHVVGVNVAQLRHRTAKGIVIGAGLERPVGFLRLIPEVRLTRWGDRNYGVHDAPLRSNLTQIEFLIGLIFR